MKNIREMFLFFCVLCVFSCKDAGSTSIFQSSLTEANDAYLKSITIKADDESVSLDSTFKSSLFRYEATVPYKAKNITLEAKANNASSIVSISPKNIEIGTMAGSSLVCVITVSSSNKEGKHRYIVQLNRAIASKEKRAASLVLSYDNGKVIPLNEAFYSGKTEYTANIPEDFNGSLKLKAFPYSAFATSKEAQAPATENTKLEVEVKAEDESIAPQKYSVVVSKEKKFLNEEASDLSIIYVSYKGKYAEYDGKTNSYILNVPLQASESDIKKDLEIKTYAKYELSEFDSTPLESTNGAKKLYLINVHNKEGKNRNYKLILVRGELIIEGKSNNAELAKIEFITDVDEIKPIDCSKNKSDVYNVPVNKKINAIQVVAIASDEKATVSISPQTSVNIGIDEEKNFEIVVRAENGAEKRYLVRASKSLSVFVRVLSEKKRIPKTDLPYLNYKQKHNEMFTGAFYSSEREMFPFEIGMYEVNYKLWYDVRTWAELQGYRFNNKGCQGEDTGSLPQGGKTFPKEGAVPTSEKQYNPVTAISYRDAIVWCNAYSEMHDMQPVYHFDNKVLRDATLYKRVKVPTTNNQFLIYDYYYADMATKDTQANGYRLPTMAEWEMASRGGDVEKDEWNYAFPGVKGFEDGKVVMENQQYSWKAISEYVWSSVNAQNKTHDVGEKKPNSLGIYDMAGNVYEICEEVKKFENPKDDMDDKYTTFMKGGSYKVSGLFPFMSPYFQDGYYTETKASDFGFRLARTIK